MADEQNKGGSTSFGRRLGEIAWGGFKDSVGSQLSSLSDIKSDADTFKSQVMQDVNDAIGTFNKFKNGSKSPMKKVRDWFYSNDMMTGGFGFDNDSDDFDAGFKIDSAGQPQDAEAPRTLDAESMNDIAKKQTGEAYKIAAKQADLQMANTAEIVSTINSRSAELAASVNKLNETLLGISKKLDNMTGVMVEKAKEEEKFRITNYDGSLSLAGVLGGAYGAKKEDASGYLDMAKMFLGQMTPQYLARMGFDKIFEHEFKALGDKSIAHYAEKFNDAIEDTMQTGLMKLVKGDLFDKLGINLGVHKREDYQRYATNQYNTKPATFDGMTRMTIVSVIPEYLKSIEAALTGGPAKTVDERGRLTTKSVNHFQNAIGGAVLSGSSDAIKDASTLAKNINSSVSGKTFYTSEVRLVLDAVKIGFLVQMEVYNSKHASVRANGIVDPDELIWGSDSPRLATAIDYAIEMLSSSDIGNGRNVDDITNAINWIMSTMTSKERRAFAQEITAAGEKITKTGMNFAQTSPFAHQASKVTQNMLQGILHNKITSRLNPSADNNETTNAAPTDHTSNPNVPGNRNIQGDANQGLIDQVSSGFSLMGMITETQTDILKAQMHRLSEPLYSIANMLRKGINVFVTGQDNSQDGPYTHELGLSMQHNSDSDFKTSLNRHMRRDNKNNVNPWNMMMNHLRSKNNSSDDNATPNVESNVGGSNASGGTTSNANADQARSIVPTAANVNVDTDSKEQILEAANDLKEARKDNPNATSGDPEKDKALLKAAEAIEKGEDPKKAMKEAAKSTTEKMKSAAGVVSEGASEVYNIIKDTQVGKFIGKHFDENSKIYKIFHSEEAQNVKDEGAKLIDSIFENVGGKVDKAKEAASSKVEALGDKVFNRNKAEQKFAGTDEEKEVLDMYNEQGTDKMMKNLNKRMTLSNSLIGKGLKSNDEQAKREAEEDQQTMQQLQMYMNSAGVDGSFSKKDIADVRVLINQIHNKRVKASMSRYFIPMMMKNSPGSAMENVEPSADGKVSKKNKSLIGSMLGGMAKYAALIFKPVTKILGSGLKVLMGISGLIIKLSGALIKSGARDLKYGMRSLGGGLFGSKKPGEESMGMLKRGITLPSRINKAIGAATGISLTKLTDTMGTFIAKTFTNMVDKVGELGKKFANVLGKAGNAIKGWFSKLGESRLGKGVKAFFGGAGNKILEKSDFLKGFTSARRAKREADVERLTSQKAKTKAEAEAEKTNTFLGAIKDLVAKIFNTTEEGQKEAKDAREKEEKEKEKANEPKKGLRERAKDKWNSIKERSASLKEKISQDGGRVGLKDALHGAGFGRAKNTEGQGSFGLDLGKMLGGITNILGGIGKIVLGAITGLSGFKTLMNMITKILSSSLTPLNKAFQKITKALRPVMITVRNALKSIAKVASDIASSVIDVVQPILQDTIMPLIEDLAPLLTDLCKIVADSILPILNVVMKVILVPLLGYVVKLMPIIEMAAAGIQVVMGILEGIFGVVSSIAGFFTGNKSLKDQGAEMMAASGTLIKQGISDFGNSTKSLFKNVLGIGTEEETAEAEPTVQKVEKQTYIEHGSILDGTYGSGDTYNYYGQVGDINSNSLKNIYGSTTAQGSYGNYLGMSKHGCGPMALADVVARRTGSNISAAGLASSMARNGTYNQNRGTSVANYINAAGSMGVGLTPGGVTSRSLSRATPNNPVTLVGSGNGFGTRNGNTHYVNVLGTKGGMAYVSNPMTGHVERRSVNDLVSRSALGLYGSGDVSVGADERGYYSFPDAVQDAMNYLKNLAGSLLKMFTGETVEEQVTAQLNEQSQANTVEEAKKLLGDDYQACEDAAREAAYADYAAQNPKLDSETDEEYQKKQEAYFQKNIVKYLAQQEVFKKASEKNGDVWANILNMHESARTYVSSTDGDWAASGAYGSAGIYGGDNEKVRMYNFGEPEHRYTNITTPDSGESPVHDFFGKMAGKKVWSSNGWANWYKQRKDPNNEGEGKTYADPGEHDGIDMQVDGGNAGNPLYAITDGTVTQIRICGSDSGGCGNAVRWKDNSGRFEHIYMHMQDAPKVKEGDKITAGQYLGKVGGTGNSQNSYGAHIHYGIYDGSGWGVKNTVNPLTYWKYHAGGSSTGNQGKITMPAELAAISNWCSAYSGNEQAIPFVKSGFEAGLSPAEVASVFSAGIIEDSAKKLFGTKSLTDVTYDKNGQAAVGILNFADIDKVAEYGFTVPDQLKYIRDAYFADEPSHSRGKTMDPYRSDYPWGRTYEYYASSKPDAANGVPIGPIINKDLIQGMAYWTGGAIVPDTAAIVADPHSSVVMKYSATAADAYNWMLDKGLFTTSPDGKTTSTLTAAERAANAASASVGHGSGYIDASGNIQFNNKYDADQYMAALADTGSQLHTGDYVRLRDKYTLRKEINGTGHYTMQSGTTSTSQRNSPYKITAYTSWTNPDTKTRYDLYHLEGSNGRSIGWYTRDSLLLNQTASAVQDNANSFAYGSMAVTQADLDAYLASDQYKQIGAMMAAANASPGNTAKSKVWNGSVSDPITGPLMNSAGITSNAKTNISYADVARLKGNGDWGIESFVGAGDDIPAINTDNAFWTEMGFGDGTSKPTQVNTYNIVRTNDAEADKRINAVLKHTFEVKSQTIEAKLDTIIGLMGSNGRSWADTYNGSSQTANTKLFDEYIPSQVSKLSVG